MFSVSKQVLNSSLADGILVGITKIEGSNTRWKNVNNGIELDFSADYATDFDFIFGNGPTQNEAVMFPSTLYWYDIGTCVFK